MVPCLNCLMSKFYIGAGQHIFYNKATGRFSFKQPQYYCLDKISPITISTLNTLYYYYDLVIASDSLPPKITTSDDHLLT